MLKSGVSNMNEYLPYIVSILVAIISGAASYFAAAKKCSADLKTLKENNSHEIDRLMQQHKLDIDSLERKHQMEIEKMELEHKHQLELKQKELENALGGSVISTMVDAMMKTPEAKQVMGQAFHSPKKR